MPEGDTLFRTARTLDRALRGKQLVRFETVLAQLSRVDDDAPIAGRTVEAVRSVGKHLLVELSGDLVLRTHMRMQGSWHIYRRGERWQRPRASMRVVLETADFQAVAFGVPVAEFRSGRALKQDPVLSTLGPDLLSDAFDVEAAVRRLRERGALGIGEALLDQRALAGIGNVYKNEVCFVEGVHPFRTVASLDEATLHRLVATARQLLARGAGTEQHFADGALRRTVPGAPPGARLWVYRRGGKRCRRCGTPIVREVRGLQGRSTYFCPSCQPMPKATASAGDRD
jgi:endonuclease-8